MMRPLVLSAVVLLSAGLAHASGTPEAPSLKPQRTYVSQVTDTKNAAILHEALRAANRYDWKTVARLQKRASDPDVRDLIMWVRASQGVPGMNFSEVSEALDTLSDWPRQSAMRRRAEEIIELSSLNHEARIDWLTASGPISGAGKLALANSLQATGDSAAALAAARDAWRNNSFDDSVRRQILARYGSKLTQEDHRARVEFLLWTKQTSNASQMKSLLTSDYRKLVDARIALARGWRGVDSKIKAVPDHLQDNPGLLYERARWRRKRGNQTGATPLLTQIDGADIPAAGRSRLWDERNIALRKDLKDNNYQRAYQLAAPHGMSAGADFAAAEWMSGWIALRLNAQPEKGLAHFEDMTAAVSTPISLSRGHYWVGRAADIVGEADKAATAYGAAAEHKYTYYGQLAAERLDDTKLYFPESSEPTAEDIDAFEARKLVRALRLLGETGNERLFRQFAYHLDDLLEREADFILLARLAEDYKVPDIGVRGAKSGLARGIVATDAAYPVVAYPLLKEPKVERPLMLALSRQESEMNPGAISHAGARGLMQFMPATARTEARANGLPYRTSWLTDDPGYNMTLGGAHLDTLLRQFNGSYIMTAAAYNAGASRPRRWVKEYGDPREGQIDPIDWVEFIPFSETRNYVQRVLENTQVYRHRLQGEPVEIKIEEDLERGRM